MLCYAWTEHKFTCVCIGVRARVYSSQRQMTVTDRENKDERDIAINMLNVVIMIIINDSIYPAVSKASRTGNKVNCQPNDCQTDESSSAA